jgi:arsenite methyltransferase
VLDLGCGAGADVCIAALLVGRHGRVIGVDITPAMVEKARSNSKLVGLHNVAIHEADIADLPLPDACADVVISNGVINLSPHKPGVLQEAFRVLRPGGHLYIADMVREGATSQGGTESSGSAWANCVAGTFSAGYFLHLLEQVGFPHPKLVSTSGYRTSPETIGALF